MYDITLLAIVISINDVAVQVVRQQLFYSFFSLNFKFQTVLFYSFFSFFLLVKENFRFLCFLFIDFQVFFVGDKQIISLFVQKYQIKIKNTCFVEWMLLVFF